jgi:hypothetical protein
MPDIFVSYRRGDAAGHARALYRDLCRRFERERIFFDRESIEAGTVFPDRLREGVASCRALLALIAPGWLDARGPDGARRLDAEEDFVRQEIAGALAQGKKVLPVLFDDTPMPAAADLPAPLRALAACDALMLRGKNLEYDVQLEELVRLLAATPGVPPPFAEGEGVLVGTGLDFDVYRDTRFAPIRLRAPLRAVFKPLIDDRTRVFAGRRQVFDRIMAFSSAIAGGYLAITAPPGFGKTALIANLVAATPEAFAYHFFAPLYGAETLDERFFLQNVLQQMAAWHGHRADLPDGVNELRALFHELVDRPLGHARVLVLDGLDEVSTWALAPYLSRRLPDYLHIVATIRDVGQDWRADYGIPAEQTVTLPLGGLDRGEIQGLFAGLGDAGVRIAADAALLDQIVARAAYENDAALGADPFYVRFLAEDMASGAVTPETIAAQPQGLGAYLDRWWKQIAALAGDAPVRDLFGTLAAAAAPIGRSDLEAVNQSLRDDWAGDFFDQVLGRVRRLVLRHDDGAFSLAHPRLHRYVADRKRIGRIQDYRQRLLDHCADWKAHRSPYALRAYAIHLEEAGKLDDLYALFSADWIAAQWSVLRSYAPLAAQLDRAAHALSQAQPPLYSRVLALVVARDTGRELMVSAPVELYEAWTRQGEIERTLASLASLGTGKGRAIEPLTAVANTLLDLAQGQATAFAEHAGELLLRAVDLLSLPRMTSERFDRLVGIAATLPASRGLPDGARTRLIAAVRQSAAEVDDAVFRGAASGAIASALCGSPPDHAAARDLFDRARAALADIDFAPDRAFVLGTLPAAFETFAPEDLMPELEALAASGAALIAHGSLRKNPCIRLLGAWTPAGAERDRAAAFLIRVAALYGGDGAEYRGAALAAIVPKLCALGRVESALQLVDECWAADPVEGGRAVTGAIDALLECAPGRVLAWLGQARSLTTPEHHDMPINRELFTGAVASACAAAGDWDAALSLVATIQPRYRADALITLLRRAGSESAASVPGRDALVERILGAARDLEDDDREGLARVAATAAQTFEAGSRARAQQELARAASLCLSSLPEGDLDDLRRLYAAALHEDGTPDALVAVLPQMMWVTAVVRTMVPLILSESIDSGRRDMYVEALFAELRRREGAALFHDALKDLTPVVAWLSRDRAPIGRALADYLVEKSQTLPVDRQLAIYGTITAGICHADADLGAAQFGRLFDWIESMRTAGVEIGAPAIGSVIQSLAAAAAPLAGRLPSLVEVARAITEGFEPGEDAITVSGALCEAVAQVDCDAAHAALAALVPAIAAQAETAPRAFYLARMIADLVQRRTGTNEAQARTARALAAAAVRCARACPSMAAAVLERVVVETLAIRSEIDRGQALVDILRSLGEAPPEWTQRLKPTVSRLPARAQLQDERLRSALLEAAVEVMAAAGDFGGAELIAAGARDDAVRQELMEGLERQRRRQGLGELDAFERAFVASDDPDLAYAVLESVKVEEQNVELLAGLVEMLVAQPASIERVRLLSTLLPQVTAPMRALSGPGGIAELIGEVERLDRAYLDAARIVGESAAPAGV